MRDHEWKETILASADILPRPKHVGVCQEAVTEVIE